MAAEQSPFRPARREDAAVLAELVNYAGEGMPLYLWGRMASEGETAWDVGRRRAAREDGSFSYRNATIIEHEGRAAGSLIGYAIPDAPEPVSSDTPAMFVPLQELENLAPGTWYVNVLAVLPPYRNLGLGSRLLGLADDTGRRLGLRGMSVICRVPILVRAVSTSGMATARRRRARWSRRAGTIRGRPGCC